MLRDTSWWLFLSKYLVEQSEGGTNEAKAKVATKKGTNSTSLQLPTIKSIIAVNAAPSIGFHLCVSAMQYAVCVRDIIPISPSSEVDLSGCGAGDVIGPVWKRSWVRERPTDIRWMLGNAVCYSGNTDTHSGEVSVSQRLRERGRHTHTDTHCAQTPDSLMSYSAIVYCYPFTTLLLLTLAVARTEWEGHIILLYIMAPLRCSPVSSCESTCDHNRTQRNQEACTSEPFHLRV